MIRPITGTAYIYSLDNQFRKLLVENLDARYNYKTVLMINYVKQKKNLKII